MGRKMALRGRPGLLFVAVLVIFLIIFYMSWKTVFSSTAKPSIKDVYAMNRRNHFNMRQEPRDQEQNYGRDIYSGRNKQVSNEERLGRDDADIKLERDLQGKPWKERNVAPQYVNNINYDKVTVRSRYLPSQKLSTVASVQTMEYYRNPNASLGNVMVNMDKFIHIDLKGAAPKLSYLKELFVLLAQLGATGLLIEYEDMFPYTGPLQMASSTVAYTRAEIGQILDLAKKNHLKVIPLIQTFGHIEFLLKSASFQKLRETSHNPQVIDITSDASYEVLHEMIKQVLDAHPDATHVHIGCDEVYELGRGASKDVMLKEGVSVHVMFLRHVRRVATIVQHYGAPGRKVMPIMWDDELRKISASDIKNASLPSLLEIMVWNYTPDVNKNINDTVWEKYSEVFGQVWIASSFKGATGSRQFYTEPSYHIKNHFSWLDVVSKYNNRIKFKGAVMTGWQRYDHFATLCELMPVALPSVAVCLYTFKNAGFNEIIHKKASAALECHKLIEMDFPEVDEKSKTVNVSNDCRFPGYEIYYRLQRFYGDTQMEEAMTHRVDGWLSDYQVSHGFSNPGQLNVLRNHLKKVVSRYEESRVLLKEALSRIYSDDTVTEWVAENINERLRKILEIQQKTEMLMQIQDWQQRPLPPVSESRQMLKSVTNAQHSEGIKSNTPSKYDLNPNVARGFSNLRGYLPDGKEHMANQIHGKETIVESEASANNDDFKMVRARYLGEDSENKKLNDVKNNFPHKSQNNNLLKNYDMRSVVSDDRGEVPSKKKQMPFVGKESDNMPIINDQKASIKNSKLEFQNLGERGEVPKGSDNMPIINDQKASIKNSKLEFQNLGERGEVPNGSDNMPIINDPKASIKNSKLEFQNLGEKVQPEVVITNEDDKMRRLRYLSEENENIHFNEPADMRRDSAKRPEIDMITDIEKKEVRKDDVSIALSKKKDAGKFSHLSSQLKEQKPNKDLSVDKQKNLQWRNDEDFRDQIMHSYEDKLARGI